MITAGYRTVKQGEHVPGIATEHGFSDYRAIWDHPENGDLKKKRIDPNVLFPGDRLFIPELETREELCSTDKRHTFVLHAPMLTLRLVLEDIFTKPITNAPCDLIVESQSTRPVTDAGGRIEQTIPFRSHSGLLIIRDEQNPAAGEQILSS